MSDRNVRKKSEHPFTKKIKQSMKKALLFAAAAASLATVQSCTKEKAADIEGAPSSVTVTISAMQSKATIADTADEAKVNGFQVFVFNGDRVDAYGKASGSEISSLSKTLTATTGERTIAVLVNAPDCAGISSLAEFDAKQSSLLSDCSEDNFVMAGKQNATIGASANVEVNVSRLAARVRIHKVTRNFTNSTLAGLGASAFSIKRFYLTNVVDNATYGGGRPSPYIWKSSSLNSPAAIETGSALVCKALQSPATLAQGSSYESVQSLYCYPNITATDSNSAKVTRLVVECLLDGDECTYVIPLGQIEGNHSYEINELVLTRPGNPSDGDDIIDDGEDDIQEKYDASFRITVNDWEQVLLGTGGTVSI